MNKVVRKEKSALLECESVIAKGLETFVDVGTALARIRDEKLYKQGDTPYHSFQLYCKERWGFTRSFADYQIEAAAVVNQLTTIVVKRESLPSTESQARAIAPLVKKDPQKAKKVLESIPAAKRTAKEIASKVRQLVAPKDIPRKETETEEQFISRALDVPAKEVIKRASEFRKQIGEWRPIALQGQLSPEAARLVARIIRTAANDALALAKELETRNPPE